MSSLNAITSRDVVTSRDNELSLNLANKCPLNFADKFRLYIEQIIFFSAKLGQTKFYTKISGDISPLD